MICRSRRLNVECSVLDICYVYNSCEREITSLEVRVKCQRKSIGTCPQSGVSDHAVNTRMLPAPSLVARRGYAL
jgi:hypothetical protein